MSFGRYIKKGGIMEIVINGCYGGFGLSHKAIMKYAELKGIKLHVWHDDIILKHDPNATFDNALFVHYSTKTKEEYDKYSKIWDKTKIKDRSKLEDSGYFCQRDIERTDPILVEIVKLLGKKANGRCAELRIIEIPDNVEWEIDEYDGMEHVAEKHKTWN